MSRRRRPERATERQREAWPVVAPCRAKDGEEPCSAVISPRFSGRWTCSRHTRRPGEHEEP